MQQINENYHEEFNEALKEKNLNIHQYKIKKKRAMKKWRIIAICPKSFQRKLEWMIFYDC